MALDIGTLVAYMEVDDRKFNDGIDRSERRMGGLGSTVGKAVGVIGAAFAGLQVGGFLLDAIGQASDLNETVNKSNVIFGESAGTIQKWAEDAAQNLGLSKTSALDAAAGFGNMFSQLGFTDAATADLSTKVVELSADLGSFNNLPTADVADRMSAAFRGEYDSLQALIPNINATRVEQEALAATGKTVASELTAQEKATAVLAIVSKDGADALNDFSETSDGLANQQKILKAEFDNVKTEIGTALLPVAQKFMGWVLREGVPALKDLIQTVKDNRDEIEDFALATAEVAVVVGQGFLELVAAGLDAFGYLTEGMLKWQGFVFDSVEAILGAFESTFGWVPGFGDKLDTAQTYLAAYRNEVEGKTRSVAKGFHGAADATRKASDAVGGLRDKINTLQASKSVKISADVRAAIGDVDALMRYINSRNGTVRVAGVTSVGGVTARASGGPIIAGSAYLVGEHGPELVVPRASGTVIPAGATRDALRGEAHMSLLDAERAERMIRRMEEMIAAQHRQVDAYNDMQQRKLAYLRTTPDMVPS